MNPTQKDPTVYAEGVDLFGTAKVAADDRSQLTTREYVVKLISTAFGTFASKVLQPALNDLNNRWGFSAQFQNDMVDFMEDYGLKVDANGRARWDAIEFADYRKSGGRKGLAEAAKGQAIN